MLIIDEISMVSNKNLQNIHKKLRKIFGYNEANPFVGKTTLSSFLVSTFLSAFLKKSLLIPATPLRKGKYSSTLRGFIHL